MQELPPWLDRQLYPFQSRYFDTGTGRLHYIDEGQGEVLIFVHGVPTWSFLYRHMIQQISTSYRCIAFDHLGFGLSEKPNYGIYHLQSHICRMDALLTKLQLKKITLVIHDWGGPIGLSWALKNLNKIDRLVVMNSWMWPVQSDTNQALVARLLASRFYRMLDDRLNFTTQYFVKFGFRDSEKLKTNIHQHYLEPLKQQSWRIGVRTLAVGIWKEEKSLATLWEQRQLLQSIPTLILWGMQDIAFPPRYLKYWKQAIPNAGIHELWNAGHFPQEEASLEVIDNLLAFMNRI